MDKQQRIRTLEEMLQADPNDIFLNYALGLEFAQDYLKTADAESQFRIVLQLNPDYVPAYYQLGLLFQSMLRIPEARQFLTSGLEKAKEAADRKTVSEFEEALFLLDEEE